MPLHLTDNADRFRRPSTYRHLMEPTSNQAIAVATERLINLEIKASFTEDLLDKLEQIITRQQDQIDHLTREVQFLRQQSPDEGPVPQRNLRDELPPHY